MAKEIRWSIRAHHDRLEILAYWIERNKSNVYSIKLNQLFIDSIELLSEMPELGRATNFPTVRIKIVRDYLIYYRNNPAYIEIISIWDSRRDPLKFKL